MSKSEESLPAYTLVSDKEGSAHADVIPGIYDIKMSRKGYMDIQITKVLVPRENETRIEFVTDKTGSIVVCQ